MSVEYSDEEIDLRRRQITALITAYYEKHEFLRETPFDILLQKAFDKYLYTDLTIEEINEKLMDEIVRRLRDRIDRYEKDSIRMNHKKLYGRLEKIIRDYEKRKIKYQLADALCGYLKYDKESTQLYDEIDFYVDEEDLDSLKELCEESGFVFEDNRMNPSKVLQNGIPVGKPDIVAIDPNTNFQIGIIPYENKKDGSLVIKNYYHDDEGNVWMRNEILQPELAKQIFGSEEIDFRGDSLSITSPEYVYLLKEYAQQENDQPDMMFLENHMDRDKLMRIRMLARDQRTIENVPVEKSVDLSNPYQDDSNDLDFMMEDQNQSPEIENTSQKKEDGKVFVKKDKQPKVEPAHESSMNEEGAISNLIISTLAFITFVLCFIGIAIIYLVK